MANEKHQNCSYIALKGARLIDVDGGRAEEEVTVLVKGNNIDYIGILVKKG